MDVWALLWILLGGTWHVARGQFSPFRESGCKVTNSNLNEMCCANSNIPCGLNEGGCGDYSHCEEPLTCQDNACVDANNTAIYGSKCCAFEGRKPLDTCLEEDISYWYYDIDEQVNMNMDQCNEFCRSEDTCAGVVLRKGSGTCSLKAVSIPLPWVRLVETGTDSYHRWCKPNCWIPDMEFRHGQTSYRWVENPGAPEECHRLCQEDVDCFTSFIYPFPYVCILRKFDHYPMNRFTYGTTMPQFCVTWNGSWGYEEELGPDVNYSVVQAPINKDIQDVCMELKSQPASVETPRHQNLFTFLFRYERLKSHMNHLGYKTANNEVFDEDDGHSLWIGRGDAPDTSLTKFICERRKGVCYHLPTVPNAMRVDATSGSSGFAPKVGETIHF